MRSMIAFFVMLGFAPLLFAEDRSVEGHWLFYKKIYQGKEMPEPPSATLRMHFEFAANGDSKLWWWHEGEQDHCQRKGKWKTEDNLIVDEVTWVDPENTSECSKDPDMQNGKVNKTPFKFRGPDLSLELHLGDEPLEMVWKTFSEL
jgi:hypothetical protein